MGILVNGEWTHDSLDTKVKEGRYVRKDTSFRRWVSAEADSEYPAESGRYHLYISITCPWAHRTYIMRKLKGLENVISLSKVRPVIRDMGWVFENEGQFKDDLYSSSYLWELYTKAKSDYTGRVSVPVLWDKKTETIVSNESSEIIRMLNSSFNDVGANQEDFYPAELREEIDKWNDIIYPGLNNGVYRAGFSKTQSAYEEAFNDVFNTFELLETHLSGRRYLAGKQLTEADIRLFATLIRFDAVYHGAFKCNRKRVQDYPNLWAYVRDICQYPGIAETIDIDSYKLQYYSILDINPRAIIPLGPEIDFSTPPDRRF